MQRILVHEAIKTVRAVLKEEAVANMLDGGTISEAVSQETISEAIGTPPVMIIEVSWHFYTSSTQICNFTFRRGLTQLW